MGQWAVGGLERKSAQEGQGQWVCDSVDSPFQCGALAQPAHFPSEGRG